MDGTASSNHFSGLATNHYYRPIPGVQPSTASVVKPEGHTQQNARWEPRTNARAGVEELTWFQEHQKELERFAGRWIAIVGQQVIASGDTFEEAYDEACSLNYSDMLILPVPKEPGEDRYLIA